MQTNAMLTEIQFVFVSVTNCYLLLTLQAELLKQTREHYNTGESYITNECTPTSIALAHDASYRASNYEHQKCAQHT